VCLVVFVLFPFIFCLPFPGFSGLEVCLCLFFGFVFVFVRLSHCCLCGVFSGLFSFSSHIVICLLLFVCPSLVLISALMYFSVCFVFLFRLFFPRCAVVSDAIYF